MLELKDQCEMELIRQLLSGSSLELEHEERGTISLVELGPGPPFLISVVAFLRLADAYSAQKLTALCLGTYLPAPTPMEDPGDDRCVPVWLFDRHPGRQLPALANCPRPGRRDGHGRRPDL